MIDELHRTARPQLWPAAAIRRVLGEPLLSLVIAVYAGLLVLIAPATVSQDSWLTFVFGREVARHGIPHNNSFTLMAQGAGWVDQQWLAQLVFYGLFSAGGIVLASFVNIAIDTATFAGVLLFARRRASARSVCLAGIMFAIVAPAGAQLRAQTLAYPLFAALLALLVCDSRRPGRRVLLVLPLLVVWANLHGSVALGVLLTVALAAGMVWRMVRYRRRDRVGTALALLASPLCLLMTPYGFGMVGYYHLMLVNPPFAGLIIEWMPTTIRSNPPFVVLALLSIWLAARTTGLSFFERAVVVVLVLAGFQAQRNAVWMAFAGPMLLSGELDRLVPPRRDIAQDLPLRVAGGIALVLMACVAVYALVRPANDFAWRWPGAATASVRVAISQQPTARVFADEVDSDWLLWNIPALRGRLVYDLRFELLSRRQSQQVWNFHMQRGDWQAAARGASVFVLDRSVDRRAIRSLSARSGTRVLYRDRYLEVLRLSSPL